MRCILSHRNAVGWDAPVHNKGRVVNCALKYDLLCTQNNWSTGIAPLETRYRQFLLLRDVSIIC